EVDGSPLYRMEPVGAGARWFNGPNIWHLLSTTEYGTVDIKRYYDLSSGFLGYARGFGGLLDSYNSRIFDLMAARYVVDIRPITAIDPAVNPDKFKLVYSDFWNVYENVDVLPRAFFAPHAEIAATAADFSRRLKD